MAAEQPSERPPGPAAQQPAAETPPDPLPAAAPTPEPVATASAPPATAAPPEPAAAFTDQPEGELEPASAAVSADTPAASADVFAAAPAAQPAAAVKQEQPPRPVQQPSSEPPGVPAPPQPFEGVQAEEPPPAEARQERQPGDTLMPEAAGADEGHDAPATMMAGLHHHGRDAEPTAQQHQAAASSQQQLFSQLSGTASFTGAMTTGNGGTGGRGSSPPDMSGVVGSHDPAFATAQVGFHLRNITVKAPMVRVGCQCTEQGAHAHTWFKRPIYLWPCPLAFREQPRSLSRPCITPLLLRCTAAMAIRTVPRRLNFAHAEHRAA